MIKIAICDDEYAFVGQVEKYLLEICKTHLIPVEIDVFYSGEALEKAILQNAQYDLLYLDIHMNGEDGITAAHHIRKFDENLLIIYVSSHDRYLMELFRLDVFDFIKKPLEYEDFKKTFLSAYQRISNRTIYFSFHYKNEIGVCETPQPA
jgi:DNA-binding LytR/AlgR family response regulator